MSEQEMLILLFKRYHELYPNHSGLSGFFAWTNTDEGALEYWEILKRS